MSTDDGLTETDREELSRLFGWVPEPEPLEQMLTAVERILAARREADAETIRGLRERYERLRADVEALAAAGEFDEIEERWVRAADLRAILARHERPESEAVEDRATGAIVTERQRCICQGVGICLDHCRACNHSGRDLEECCIADPEWEPDDDDLARREDATRKPEVDR